MKCCVVKKKQKPKKAHRLSDASAFSRRNLHADKKTSQLQNNATMYRGGGSGRRRARLPHSRGGNQMRPRVLSAIQSAMRQPPSIVGRALSINRGDTQTASSASHRAPDDSGTQQDVLPLHEQRVAFNSNNTQQKRPPPLPQKPNQQRLRSVATEQITGARLALQKEIITAQSTRRRSSGTNASSTIPASADSSRKLIFPTTAGGGNAARKLQLAADVQTDDPAPLTLQNQCLNRTYTSPETTGPMFAPTVFFESVPLALATRDRLFVGFPIDVFFSATSIDGSASSATPVTGILCFYALLQRASGHGLSTDAARVSYEYEEKMVPRNHVSGCDLDMRSDDDSAQQMCVCKACVNVAQMRRRCEQERCEKCSCDTELCLASSQCGRPNAFKKVRRRRRCFVPPEWVGQVTFDNANAAPTFAVNIRQSENSYLARVSEAPVTTAIIHINEMDIVVDVKLTTEEHKSAWTQWYNADCDAPPDVCRRETNNNGFYSLDFRLATSNQSTQHTIEWQINARL